mmetsp:Transcript_9373/g.19792  ORF Transcript_9373/g.19792 Transcript_9373/m.19792 type:complete len:315 (-) Transcript_9373:199-1143(-)
MIDIAVSVIPFQDLLVGQLAPLNRESTAALLLHHRCCQPASKLDLLGAVLDVGGGARVGVDQEDVVLIGVLGLNLVLPLPLEHLLLVLARAALLHRQNERALGNVRLLLLVVDRFGIDKHAAGHTRPFTRVAGRRVDLEIHVHEVVGPQTGIGQHGHDPLGSQPLPSGSSLDQLVERHIERFLRIFGQRFGVGAQRVVDLHDALVFLFHDLRARFELVHLLRQIVRRERRVQKPHVFLRSAAATTLLAPPVQDPVVIRVELGALLLGLRPVRLKIDQVDRDAERALAMVLPLVVRVERRRVELHERLQVRRELR